MTITRNHAAALSDVLLDVPSAAERLGCTPRYVRRLVMERRIPFVKLGGSKVRFSALELEQWIDTQRVGTAKR
ncbi:MAG: helix-turn-helix transcriptional regulator [Acidimicrobiales bacterium]